jgi:hypothetical protein
MKLTPEDVKREKNSEIIQTVLTEKCLQFSINELVIRESVRDAVTGVECTLSVENLEGKSITYNIEGTGGGLLDALFNTLIEKLVGDCHSLSNLSLEEFQVCVDEKDLKKLRKQGRGTDAHVEISLIINNGSGKLIPFRSRSRSMIAASTEIVSKTVEFFVNSERAVLRLRTLIEDARSRNRADLADQYTGMLSSLVCNTSYEESLKKTKNSTT